jgi:hypothetical protein
MTQCLKVQLNHDDDGTASLSATVKYGEFSGKGEAWFNISDIKEFIDQLENFSKTNENPPSLEGGNWDGEGNLIETLLSFRFYSFSTGRIGVHVILADYPYTDCRNEEISRVFVELKVEAQAVIEFAKRLYYLLNSKNGEALLECH